MAQLFMAGRENLYNLSLCRFLFSLGLLVAMIALPVRSLHAQHTDYILGSAGLLSAQQPPPGIYYQNQPSYYWASKSDTGPFGRLDTQSNLDLFVDLNTIGWTTPWTLFGAHYGMQITVPLVNTNGSLDTRTQFPNPAVQQRLGVSRSDTSDRFGFSSIYVEPINFGWHEPRYDAFVSFGFFAPAGDYDPKRAVNTGLGRWAEMFSVGGIAYFDDERKWSLSTMARYLIHQKQQGIDATVGDDVILEWGLARSFQTSIGQVDVGVDGYAYWQVTNTTGSAVPSRFQSRRGSTYALGPEIAATTKFGRYFLRFFSEFGGSNTPQGNQIMLGAFLLF
ncbi:SphA family protein [Azospirillum sp. sgz302134]